MKKLLSIVFLLSFLFSNSQTGVIDYNYWGLKGNTISNNTSFLGTKSNRSIIFKANNSQAFKIDSVKKVSMYGDFLLDQSGGVNSINPKKVIIQPWPTLSTYLALYLFQNIPNGTNYFAIGDTNQIILNAKKLLLFNTGHVRWMSAQSTQTTAGSTITFDSVTNTMSVANVEHRHFTIAGSVTSYTPGTTALVRNSLISANTSSALTTATITNNVGLEVNVPVTGTGMTITNNAWSIYGKGDCNFTTKVSIGSALLLPTAKLHLAAGTSAVTTAPLKFTPGALMTVPEAGAKEYDGKVFYSSPEANNRGVTPTIYYIRQNADYTLSNVATIQQIFNTTTNGQITLPVGVYEFEGLVRVTGMSVVSGNASISFAGTATTTHWLGLNVGFDSAPTTGPGNVNGGFVITSSFASPSMQSASAANMMATTIKGVFKVTVAGTIIPSITLADAVTPSGIVTAGSYLKINCLGGTSAGSVGNWD